MFMSVRKEFDSLKTSVVFGKRQDDFMDFTRLFLELSSHDEQRNTKAAARNQTPNKADYLKVSMRKTHLREEMVRKIRQFDAKCCRKSITCGFLFN